MELWIARDKNEELYLWSEEPYREPNNGCFNGCGYWYDISAELFSEVTWENSPKKVRIELLED